MSVCLYSYQTYPVRKVQHMRHIIWPPMASLAVPYFSTLPHKRHDFENKILNKRILI